MKTGESKSSAFKRLAANRTNGAIRNIRLLGNLSNRHNYSYTEEEFKSIFEIIEEELKLTKSRFLVGLRKKRKFKL
ncbi:MAG: hypothetical protein PHX84_01235 [Candidatus Shapirobacteria bacterium]|nr:hypothetical protein [Candidatus Shapirobacteria bacterium]